MAGAKMMTREDMDHYIKIHIQHAQAYKNLDFDGGMFDFCHNFNIGKFLNPATNWRTDEYGGSFENRIRFPVEVIKAIRAAMGEDYLLVVNAPNIGAPIGMDMDEAAEFLKRIDPYIDLLQVRGMHPDHDKVTVCESAELSKGLKERGVKTPIAISTYYKDLDSLNEVIASGAADLVAPGHLFICNEHLGEILRDGNGEDLNPCIECHCCRGTSSTGDWMSHCTINPEIGMEHRAKRLIEPVTRQKKIALIGGGPGAIKCAMWLKDRGHTPVIFEQSDALGGQIKTAEYPEFKWELRRYLDFLRNQVVRKDIEVHLNTRATPEMIEAQGFDVVIAATGAVPKKPAIPGAETTDWNGVNIYGQQEKLGKKVVVIGGSSVAAEAACYLAECGHEVVEISRQGRLAYDLNPIRVIGYMNSKAQTLGVQVVKKAKTTAIAPGKVTYVDRKGLEHTVECDDVVACGGMEPCSEAAIAFRDAAPEFYMIGDCRQPGNMRNAIRDAYALAMRI
jgi:thioredoxin reductase